MDFAAAIFGLVLIVLVLWEGFETVVLPRRGTRRFRFTRFFFRRNWRPWGWMVDTFIPARRRETWFSFFGPLSLLLLLSIWALGLIAGFALLHWACGSAVLTRNGTAGFLTDLYLSGTTFFTLGLGDIALRPNLSRFLVVRIGDGVRLPRPHHRLFSRPQPDVRPPRGEHLAPGRPRRFATNRIGNAEASRPYRGMEALRQLLHEWELWSAGFLEGHLSYPVLAFFRSQHNNQSWLGALTSILDTCALIMAGLEGPCARQAELTFAMTRHAVIDLSLVFKTIPLEPATPRLTPEKLVELRTLLAGSGLILHEGEAFDRKLTELRELYESYVNAMAAFFGIAVPPWIAEESWVDNWQSNVWDRHSHGRHTGGKSGNGHF